MTPSISHLKIPACARATVELWFVSYDWPKVMATNVTVSPQISYGGGDWYNFTALSEPNGNMTLRVNEPTVINVTLTVPKGGSTGVGLGGNYRATLVDVKSNFGFLDSSCNIYEEKPILSVQPSNVTDEESFKIKIFNPGPWSVEYGDIYQIEKMVNGSWKPVLTEMYWEMVGVKLGAGGEWSQSVNATGLDSGLYRVSKEIGYDRKKEQFSAEFNVTRPLESGAVLPHWGLRCDAGIIEESSDSPDHPTLSIDNMGARTIYVDESYTLFRARSWCSGYNGEENYSARFSLGRIVDKD